MNEWRASNSHKIVHGGVRRARPFWRWCAAWFIGLATLAILTNVAGGGIKNSVWAQADRSTHCANGVCASGNPLGWQESRENLTLTFLGGTINDDANDLRIAFPPASVLINAAVTYTATTMGEISIGESVSLRHGEILGIFELTSRTVSPWSEVEGVGAVSPEQSTLLRDWSLRLNYPGCSTPQECELAFYDEASLSCLWLNPRNGDWETVRDEVDVDINRLSCESDTLGVHAIVARRAQTSGEVESLPIFLPLVTGSRE